MLTEYALEDRLPEELADDDLIVFAILELGAVVVILPPEASGLEVQIGEAKP